MIVDDPKALNAKRPVAPIELDRQDRLRRCSACSATTTRTRTRDQVNRTEAVLKKLGKNYEFHRYDGAGHAFFNTRAASPTAPKQAADGWKKVFAFFNKHLG